MMVPAWCLAQALQLSPLVLAEALSKRAAWAEVTSCMLYMPFPAMPDPLPACAGTLPAVPCSLQAR